MAAAARAPLCKLGGYTRDRQGCLTCRRRKKKCVGRPEDPESSPNRCAQCQRLNLRCVWEHEQDIAEGPASRSSSSTALMVARPLPLLRTSSSEDGAEAPLHRRMAMRYYVQKFAGTLSTNAENNEFLSVLLPMAMESSPLLDALVAWSTSHLALHQGDMQVRALEDRSRALRSFAAGLQQLPREIAVAICLVLTSMESILGNTSDWYNHLSAAASMIKTTLRARSSANSSASSFEETTEGRWLLRNFAYHDILASVSLDRDLLIPDLDWLGQSGNILDTYLGLGCKPVTLLGQISALSRTLANADATAASTHQSRGAVVTDIAIKLANIEVELLDWRATGPENDPLTASAEIYRSAALICLYRTQRFYGLDDADELKPRIDEQVAHVIHHMHQMPIGSPPECTLLFPLFMTGGETDNVEYQQAIEARLNSIVQDRSFENVRVALDVLKEVWDVKARTRPIDPAKPYDFNCVLERRNWSLALS